MAAAAGGARAAGSISTTDSDVCVPDRVGVGTGFFSTVVLITTEKRVL